MPLYRFSRRIMSTKRKAGMTTRREVIALSGEAALLDPAGTVRQRIGVARRPEAAARPRRSEANHRQAAMLARQARPLRGLCLARCRSRKSARGRPGGEPDRLRGRGGFRSYDARLGRRAPRRLGNSGLAGPVVNGGRLPREPLHARRRLRLRLARLGRGDRVPVRPRLFRPSRLRLGVRGWRRRDRTP